MTYHAPGSGDNPRPAQLQAEPKFEFDFACGLDLTDPIVQYHYTLLDNPTSPQLTQHFQAAIIHTIKQAIADPNPIKPDLRDTIITNTLVDILTTNNINPQTTQQATTYLIQKLQNLLNK